MLSVRLVFEGLVLAAYGYASVKVRSYLSISKIIYVYFILKYR